VQIVVDSNVHGWGCWDRDTEDKIGRVFLSLLLLLLLNEFELQLRRESDVDSLIEKGLDVIDWPSVAIAPPSPVFD
jgi:hypothetical protein